MSEDWRERMERQMAFIVEQQAQYEERSAKADERWAKGDERWSRTEESIRALLAIAQIHEREIGELREIGKATDERLSALINVVERQISEGRNGQT
ncbi:MAG: hypothetical protein ACR2G5_06160 [Pyrinomonadaceae bacterium]